MMSNGDFSLGPSEASSDKIVVIVGGVRHETYKSTLMTLPGSRLARLVDTGTSPSEVFFDRHPEVFTHVLQYYRSGKLHCPTNLCGVLLEEEFAFWGISGTDMEPCCWAAFRKHRDAVEALAQIDPSVMEKEENSGKRGKSGISRPWQSKLWALFDDPCSSIAAKVIGITSLLFILLSIIAFTLEQNTIFNPPMNQTKSKPWEAKINGEENWYIADQHSPVLDTIELVCLIWFLIEFLIRVLSCPSKCRFFMNALNIVDLLALLPWFLGWCSGPLCTGVLGFLRVMRCIRLFRVFKLMQHVLGVRVLIYTLRASAAALCIVPLLLFICAIVFSTMAYYAELAGDEHYSSIKDIPSGFWWAVVTLTTVGYGDMYPVTVQGRCVAILCAGVGVLLIILPVPIIVSNFMMFYSLAKAKYSMPRRREKPNVDTGPSSSKTSA